MDRATSKTAPQPRRGATLLYVLFALAAFCGLVSLAVDYGHVQVVKTQLQTAADAAARAGVNSLASGTASAQNNAVQTAAANIAGGQKVVLNTSTDVEFGSWDKTFRTFTVLTGSAASSANALRITARRSNAAGNPVKLYFASLFGLNSCDVVVSSTASRTPSPSLSELSQTSPTPFPLVSR